MRPTPLLLSSFASLLILALPAAANAELKLPSVFSDHMVLQQGIKLPIWGRANPGEKVSITVGDHQGAATADANGQWKALLDPLPQMATPTTLEVKTNSQSFKVNDVLVGDVWLLSGQSNMAYRLGNMPDGKQWAAKANNPTIRFFDAGKTASALPLGDVEGHWELVSPTSALHCSAVSYFMGKYLQDAGKGPQGLLVVSTGGMPLSGFMSLDSLKADPAFKSTVAEYHAANLPMTPVGMKDFTAGGTYHDGKIDHSPTIIYNGSLHPLMPYGLKGMVFYHGASDTKNEEVATEYRAELVALIRDWRKGFEQGNVPFIIEQINPTGNNANRAFVRNSQLLALSEPNTGLSVSIDIGEKDQQHFADKSDIGMRLALAARELAYGEKVVGFGPIYKDAAVENGKMRVSFTHADSGLVISAPPPAANEGTAMPTAVSDFEIAGADGKFVPATAVIDGQTVVASSPSVPNPKMVRYAWSSFPEPWANLYNKEKLPASPFDSHLR